MNDKNNSSGAFDNKVPFSTKPFSEDVWERAYRNVGRPFESMNKNGGFEEKSTSTAFAKETDATTTSKSTDVKKATEAHRKTAKKPANKSTTSATYINSVSSDTYTTSSSYSASPSQKSYSPSAPSKVSVEPPKSYINDDSEDEKSESLLEMLSDISSVDDLRKIARKLKESDLFKKPGFWVAAAVILFYLTSILSALFG